MIILIGEKAPNNIYPVTEKYLYLIINIRRKEFVSYSAMRSIDFETDICRTKKYDEQYLSQYLIVSIMSGKNLPKKKIC